MRRWTATAAAALAVLSLARAQAPPGTARCATPDSGVLTGAACDSIGLLLPIVVPAPDSLGERRSLDRADLEAILLAAIGRTIPGGARADSAWAFQYRDTTHIWGSIALGAGRRADIRLRYWRWEPNHTLTLLCRLDVTPSVPFGNAAAIGAVAGGAAGEFAGCVRQQILGDSTAHGVTAREPPSGGRLILPLALALAALPIIWWLLFHRRRPDFWKLVARYPDKAYDWFLDHDEWLVVDPEARTGQPPSGREFDGPFLVWVPKLGGRRVLVYGRRGKMDDSQTSFLSVHALDSEGLDRG